MQCLSAGELRPLRETLFFEELAHAHRGRDDEIPRDALAGIEVEHQHVRVLDVVDGRRPGTTGIETGSRWQRRHDAGPNARIQARRSAPKATIIIRSSVDAVVLAGVSRGPPGSRMTNVDVRVPFFAMRYGHSAKVARGCSQKRPQCVTDATRGGNSRVNSSTKAPRAHCSRNWAD
jgi:hypothetical protein